MNFEEKTNAYKSSIKRQRLYVLVFAVEEALDE